MAQILSTVILVVLILGLVGYLVLVFFSYMNVPWLGALKTAVGGSEALTIGLPVSAVGAYGVVALLLLVFPPKLDAPSGDITFKFFSLEFTGPSGPITLWLLCFLSFVLAVKTLRR